MIRVVAGVLGQPEGDGLFVGLRRGPAAIGKWEFPGGKLEEGESDASALRREWDEEMGWTPIVGEKVFYGEFVSPVAGPFSLAAYRVELVEKGRLPKYNSHTQFAMMPGAKLLELPDDLATMSLKPIVRAILAPTIVKCPECSGYGFVEAGCALARCEDCRGSGKVELRK